MYNITKAVYEEAERFAKYYGEENSVIKANPLAGCDPNFPVHPGAMKFYQEIGLAPAN